MMKVDPNVSDYVGGMPLHVATQTALTGCNDHPAPAAGAAGAAGAGVGGAAAGAGAGCGGGDTGAAWRRGWRRRG